MTYEEKTDKTKQNRSNELNSKVGLSSSLQAAQDENTFNLNYLWDDGTDIGINDLFKLYYDEINYENNATINKPSVYTKAGWNTVFESILDYTADPEVYIFDDVGNHNWGQEFQTGTSWFHQNGLSAGSSSEGILEKTTAVTTAIGVNATVTGAYESNYDYTSQAAAEAARDIYIATTARAGSGVKGPRTKDVDPVSTSSTFIDPDTFWRYEVGDGVIDTPNSYLTKTTFIATIDNLRNVIKDISTYQVHLTNLYNEVDKIFDTNHTNHNTKLYEIGITTDMIDDRATITSLKNSLDTEVISLDTYYTFFSGDDGTHVNFDTNINGLETVITTITNLITTRATNIYNGSILGANEGDKLKKHRLFWSKTIIKKPDGSLSSIKSIDSTSDIATNIEDKITVANNELNVLIGNSAPILKEWIARPTLYAAYYDPTIDKITNEITIDKTGLVYSGQFHATGYKIFRREASNADLDNTNWGDAPITTFTDLADNGFIGNTYFDTTVEQNKIYVYRISVIDATNDISYATESKQTKFFDDDNSFILNSKITNVDLDAGVVYAVSKINTGEHSFKKNTYCVIEDGVNNGFYVILEIDDTNIWIYPQIPENSTGFLYHTNSVVSTTLSISANIPSSPSPPTGEETGAITLDNVIVSDRDPTFNDDEVNTSGSGYMTEGMLWLNTTTFTTFICYDATSKLAIWKDMSSGISTIGTIQSGTNIAVNGTLTTINELIAGDKKIIKWLVYLTGNSNYSAFELFVVNEGNSTIDFTTYAILGYEFNITINVTIVGSAIRFTIQNNETFDINVNYSRIDLE